MWQNELWLHSTRFFYYKSMKFFNRGASGPSWVTSISLISETPCRVNSDLDRFGRKEYFLWRWRRRCDNLGRKWGGRWTPVWYLTVCVCVCVCLFSLLQRNHRGPVRPFQSSLKQRFKRSQQIINNKVHDHVRICLWITAVINSQAYRNAIVIVQINEKRKVIRRKGTKF